VRPASVTLALLFMGTATAAAPPVDAPLSTPTVDASRCPKALRTPGELRERFADRPGKPGGVQYITCWVQETGFKDESTGEFAWTEHYVWTVGGRIGYHTPRGGGDCGGTFHLDATLENIGGGGGPCDDDDPRDALPEYGPFAEGFASEDATSGIRVRSPVDAPFDYAALCPRAPRVTRLETKAERVSFAVGESWPLTRLVVVAVDDHGRPLPEVPIVLDLSRADTGPDFWPPARLQAQEPASLRLRIRTLCAPNQRELVLPLEIVAERAR
jgi:hypothetical protein